MERTSAELDLLRYLEESCSYLNEGLDGFKPDVAIVLGSGLGPLAEMIDESIVFEYADIPHMKRTTATSHKGRLVFGMLGKKKVCCMQGRLHGYEGNTAQEVAYPIWLMHELGCKTLITTNAAGAINPGYRVGDFCIMRDHINLTGRNPIAGLEPDKLAFRFFSMYECYDPQLRKIARDRAVALGIPCQEGVYLGLLGPSFETAAEIQAFARLGADTVAMSVCEEVIAARHVGMKVLGMSLCSNMACGVELPSDKNVDDEVMEVAQQRSGDFCRLVTSILEHMPI